MWKANPLHTYSLGSRSPHDLWLGLLIVKKGWFICIYIYILYQRLTVPESNSNSCKLGAIGCDDHLKLLYIWYVLVQVCMYCTVHTAAPLLACEDSELNEEICPWSKRKRKLLKPPAFILGLFLVPTTPRQKALQPYDRRKAESFEGDGTHTF